MIKMLTAVTEEVDDVGLAVKEIADGLKLEGNLLKNSVAIINCMAEFETSGVLKAVSDSLPCEAIGCTTLYNRVSGGGGMINSLCVTVLTADDAEFGIAILDDMARPVDELKKTYKKAEAAFGHPALLIAFTPLIVQLGGLIFQKAAEIVGDVPMFGTSACDEYRDYRTAGVIIDGKIDQTAAAFIMIKGNVNPKFYMTAISSDKLRKQQAIITKAHECILTTVNDMLAADYFETQGISRENGVDGVNIVPLLINYNDGGAPVALAVYEILENGEVVCGGGMTENATLSLGTLECDDILKTSAETIKNAADSKGDLSCMFIFPCLSRITAFGGNYEEEPNVILPNIPAGVPYNICYSGGEICPVYINGGKTVNRFHNFSIIVMTL